MTNNIIQQSPEWKQEKQLRIGGSEIFSLAFHYCQPELEKLGIDLIKEQPFKSALEIYLRVKFQCEEEPILVVNAQYGLGMEDYITSRLNSENQDLEIEGTRDFIINEDIHKLACCSPDGYVEVKEGQILRDFDDTCDITQNMGKGTLEMKTTQHKFNYEAEAGTRFSYIFQLQYNMMLLGHQWGMLACLTPKDKEGDSDFFKGKILSQADIIRSMPNETGGDPNLNGLVALGAIYQHNINALYNLYTYTYPAIKPIQDICKLALERFQTALDNNKLPNPSRGNLDKLKREKKMLAVIHPERFDTLEADEGLNGLLSNRQTAFVEAKKATSEQKEYEIEILKKMGDHIEIEGTEYKAKFDVRGALRFSKIK
ncbi:MAG: hypothetical protein HWN81_12035 [Candidatus Lokiarchaeota archaeon]|nr:hypothetical protein [Candidatus Lokiarchaeota archaeon]